MSAEIPRIEQVGASDEPAALALIFSAFEPAESRRRIARLRERCGDHPVPGLWAAYRGPRIVGAVHVEVQPGRTAVVAPPRTASGEPSETARALLVHVIERLAAQGVQLASALLGVDHGDDAQLLGTAGFRHASDLLYLVSTPAAFPDQPPAASLQFETYAPRRHQRLARLIERTSEHSLDMRAIDGVRRTDDVLAGYKAGGVFDPARWLIARHDGADVGCVLLSALTADGAERNEWELTYLGVVPEARGRGFGLAMVRHAQWLARRGACDRLALAVDAENEPALAVYAAAGFLSWDRRSVFLRVF